MKYPVPNNASRGFANNLKSACYRVIGGCFIASILSALIYLLVWLLTGDAG